MAILYQVDSGYFCAAVVTERIGSNEPIITDCADVFKKYAMGKTEKWFLGYCGRKGWQVVCVGYCEGRKHKKKWGYYTRGRR